MAQQIFPGVYRINGKLCTVSTLKGFKVHDEDIIKAEGKEFRDWDPFHSKLAAAISRGLKAWPFRDNASVLYLGAANGVTCSFLSDAMPNGTIYAVEFSAQSGRDLITVSEKKQNLLPIIEDARFPERYSDSIDGKVDVVYEDVSDREQVQILIGNCDRYLKNGGIAMLAVKSRSIDSSAPPRQIYARVISELRDHFEVLEKLDLGMFERDHMFLVLKKN
ncbi:MAG: fibrillarin-like rRNA/tRNA 2'-O-methyltransferase [Candidatus Micrarchaeota archaeon]